jgi:hypothetical protein
MGKAKSDEDKPLDLPLLIFIPNILNWSLAPEDATCDMVAQYGAGGLDTSSSMKETNQMALSLSGEVLVQSFSKHTTNKPSKFS